MAGTALGLGGDSPPNLAAHDEFESDAYPNLEITEVAAARVHLGQRGAGDVFSKITGTRWEGASSIGASVGGCIDHWRFGGWVHRRGGPAECGLCES